MEKADDGASFLEELFGDDYLDHADNSGNVPQDIQDTLGPNVVNISELLDQAMKSDSGSCFANQNILLRVITGEGALPREILTTAIHSQSCRTPRCFALRRIGKLDNNLNPCEMRKSARNQGLI